MQAECIKNNNIPLQIRCFFEFKRQKKHGFGRHFVFMRFPPIPRVRVLVDISNNML